MFVRLPEGNGILPGCFARSFSDPSLKREISCKRACYQFGANSFPVFTWDLSDRSVPELPCHLLWLDDGWGHCCGTRKPTRTEVSCRDSTDLGIFYTGTLHPSTYYRICNSAMVHIEFRDVYVYLYMIDYKYKYYYIHHAAVSNFYMALIKK